MSDLVRMTKSGFPVRWVPREAVKSMIQNGWSSAPLDVPTSDERAETESELPPVEQAEEAELESPPKRRRRSTPSGAEREGEGGS